MFSQALNLGCMPISVAVVVDQSSFCFSTLSSIWWCLSILKQLTSCYRILQLMFPLTYHLRGITHDFKRTPLPLKTRFHRSWYRGTYTNGDQSSSFCVFTSIRLSTSWCTSSCRFYNLCFHQPTDSLNSPMISSLFHSLWKRVFIGHDIGVYTPMKINLLVST